jgi:hypothetical protein
MTLVTLEKELAKDIKWRVLTKLFQNISKGLEMNERVNTQCPKGLNCLLLFFNFTFNKINFIGIHPKL